MKKGFTLIEMLVVITIIVFLSALGLTYFSRAQAGARDSKRKADLKEIEAALAIYWGEKGSYPITTGWRSPSPTWGDYGQCGAGTAAYIPDLCPTYMKLLPNDPLYPDTASRGYLYNSNGINYKVLALNVVETVSPIPTNDPFWDPRCDISRGCVGDAGRCNNDYAIYTGGGMCW